MALSPKIFMGGTRQKTGDLLPGTLDMLVLKAVARGPRHGYSIAEWIQQMSEDVLRVEEGALYPALHRLELRGLLASEWGTSENNRRAKFYRLTATGKNHSGPGDRRLAPDVGRTHSHHAGRLRVLRERLCELWLRVRALWLRRRLDRDLEEELAFHLAMREERYRAEGLEAAPAHAAAQRRFGNVVSLKEASASFGPSAPSSGQPRTCATGYGCSAEILASR